MGRMGYLNVLPIYHALESGALPHGYELVYGPPAALNELMARGELVAASTSCVEYARRFARYWLVPDLAIGSRGPVMSVLLLSRRPVEELAGRTVLVSAETHTSAALLRLLFTERLGIAVRYATGAASERIATANPPEAVLAIGDEALRLRGHPAYPQVWDLGEAWMEWTGLPFIFGVWVVSRQAAARGLLPQDPAALLHAGRDWGLAHMPLILDIARQNYPLSREDLTAYFNGLSYRLLDEEQEGLRLFYHKLALAGEIPAVPPLAFWTGS
jgi:chorismate dehydratase